MLRPQRVACVK
jgi:hypothetical protein